MLKPDKIIFLDIDGVLNSEKSALLHKNNELCAMMPHKIHLEPLSNIVKKTGAKIVISSTWRIGCSSCMIWEMFFTALGYPELIVIGVTPKLVDAENHSRPRGFEIDEWIQKRNKAASQSYAKNWLITPVGRFVIIDDDPDMVHLSDHLFLTDGIDGLTEEIAENIITFLNMEQ